MSDQEDIQDDDDQVDEEEPYGEEGGEDTKDEEDEKGEEEEKEEKEEGEEEEKEEDEEKVEEEEEEKLPEVSLTLEMIPECISLLCKIGDGLGHAYVRLDAQERELTDIKLLCQFIYLRYVDLSKNNLRDITPLNHLTELLALKVDNNQLLSAGLDALPYLQTASFSYNKLKSLTGIRHPLLEQLNVTFNEITDVSGLDPVHMSRLHTLEIRGNKLEHCGGFNLPNLRNLFLAQNMLVSLVGLDKLTRLTTLHLRDNQLETFDGLTADLINLQYINVRGNNFTNLKECAKLQVLPKLRALVLADNPCAEEDDYRMEVLIGLRKLQRLDKDEFNDDERKEAEEVYEMRRQEELEKEGVQEEVVDNETLED